MMRHSSSSTASLEPGCAGFSGVHMKHWPCSTTFHIHRDVVPLAGEDFGDSAAVVREAAAVAEEGLEGWMLEQGGRIAVDVVSFLLSQPPSVT